MTVDIYTKVMFNQKPITPANHRVNYTQRDHHWAKELARAIVISFFRPRVAWRPGARTCDAVYNFPNLEGLPTPFRQLCSETGKFNCRFILFAISSDSWELPLQRKGFRVCCEIWFDKRCVCEGENATRGGIKEASNRPSCSFGSDKQRFWAQHWTNLRFDAVVHLF